MRSKEFVLWLKGFTDALPPDVPATLKQWTTLKDKLAEVNDGQPIGVPIGGEFAVPNTQPFPKWQEPHNIFVPCYTPGTTITTTPGSSIGIISTPNGTTSTTFGYPSGSAWSFTNG